MRIHWDLFDRFANTIIYTIPVPLDGTFVYLKKKYIYLNNTNDGYAEITVPFRYFVYLPNK